MNTATFLRLAVAASIAAALGGCSKPSCPEGELAAAWQSAPLTGIVPSGVHVCEMPAGEASTHVRFWRDETVHRANMDAVGGAQDHGWDRTSDNWYDSTGDFNTPKWSEFANDSGTLRIDVEESGGGAIVDAVFTPRG